MCIYIVSSDFNSYIMTRHPPLTPREQDTHTIHHTHLLTKYGIKSGNYTIDMHIKYITLIIAKETREKDEGMTEIASSSLQTVGAKV